MSLTWTKVPLICVNIKPKPMLVAPKKRTKNKWKCIWLQPLPRMHKTLKNYNNITHKIQNNLMTLWYVICLPRSLVTRACFVSVLLLKCFLKTSSQTNEARALNVVEMLLNGTIFVIYSTFWQSHIFQNWITTFAIFATVTID